MDAEAFREDISDEEKIRRLRLFMLSVTLKDLSVMITFSKHDAYVPFRS